MILVAMLFLFGAVIMFCLCVWCLIEGFTFTGIIALVACILFAGSVVFVPVLRHAMES